MPAELTHLLLTRFNTAINFAPSARRLERDWLTARLELFERYCLPSVAGQKGADFRWLIFFDEASPDWFKEKISSFEPLVNPLYVAGPATDEVIARRVMQTGLVTTPYLVSTRLDNDDALAYNHLALVQKGFRHQTREFISFPFGFQSFRGHLYNVYWPSNPFLSLIEKVKDGGTATTVFCVAHDRVAHGNRVRKILSPPQWLQVLHDTNCANSLRGWPCLRSRSHPNFPIALPDASPDSLASRFRISTQHYVKRANRIVARFTANGTTGAILSKTGTRAPRS
jgi:hypothetical protein